VPLDEENGIRVLVQVACELLQFGFGSGLKRRLVGVEQQSGFQRDLDAFADAIDVGTRIREVTSSLPLTVGDGVNVRLTVSIGAVEWDRIETPEQLDRRATIAMNGAQVNGGNRLEVGAPCEG